MQRCTTQSPHTTRPRRNPGAIAAALALGLGLLATVPAQAQTATFAPVQGQVRAFPPQALRGTLVVSSTSEATVDGKQLLLAPAFKLYNPQNATIRPGTVQGQELHVNYVVEKASGRLHAAWILNGAEAQLKRDRADNGFWSSLFK